MGRGSDNNLLYGNLKPISGDDYHSLLELAEKQETVNQALNYFIKAQQSATVEGIGFNYLEKYNNPSIQLLSKQMHKQCELIFKEHARHHQARMRGLEKKRGRASSISKLPGFEKQADEWLKAIAANQELINQASKTKNLFDPIQLLSKTYSDQTSLDNAWNANFCDNRYQTVFWRGFEANIRDNPYTGDGLNQDILNEIRRLPETDPLYKQVGLNLNKYLLIEQSRQIKQFLETEANFNFNHLPHIVTDSNNNFHCLKQLAKQDEIAETLCGAEANRPVTKEVWKETVKLKLAELRKIRLNDLASESEKKPVICEVNFCENCFPKNKLLSAITRQQPLLNSLINPTDPTQHLLKLKTVSSEKHLKNVLTYIQADNTEQLKSLVSTDNKQLINQVIALRIKEHFNKLSKMEQASLNKKLKSVLEKTDKKELVRSLITLSCRN